MNKIYDSLSPNSKATVNSILDKVMGSILDDNDKVNVNMLKAVLEQLNAEKQNLKAQIKADNDAIKAAEKEATVARGKKLADQLEVGDLVTFIMGAKKFEKNLHCQYRKLEQVQSLLNSLLNILLLTEKQVKDISSSTNLFLSRKKTELLLR